MEERKRVSHQNQVNDDGMFSSFVSTLITSALPLGRGLSIGWTREGEGADMTRDNKVGEEREREKRQKELFHSSSFFDCEEENSTTTTREKKHFVFFSFLLSSSRFSSFGTEAARRALFSRARTQWPAGTNSTPPLPSSRATVAASPPKCTTSSNSRRQ